MRKQWLLVLGLVSAISLSAQLNWPAATQATKPWTRWWWEGSAVNKTELTRLLGLYQQAGLGGVEITPIYGVKGTEDQFIDFLSPRWVEMLQHTLKEAGRLGMGVDMATGTGWPFGGPWIDYENACKQVVYKSWTVQGGQRVMDRIAFTQEPMYRSASNRSGSIKDVKEPVESNRNLQELAIDQVKFEKALPLLTVMAYPDKGMPVDLTAQVGADGSLSWTAPAGSWQVYALFMGWHGKMVERAAPGGEGNVIDHFSEQAINAYFKKFNSAFAGHDISALRGFFNDSYEVDDARGQSNWTPDFFREFSTRRGYDLRLHLPALLGKITGEYSDRVLYDYRETISELLLEKFTKPWADWAHGHKAIVRNQSHGSPGNTMDLYAAVDIPETEGTEILRYKFATSAAHVTGKPLVAAEAATWLGEHFVSTLGDVKQVMDKYFVGGVNHIVYHGTNYSPAGDPWPGWLFYAAVHFHPNNPFWAQFPALNKYVERSQRFLQAGKPDNDILVYYPYADAQMERGRDLLKHYDAMKPEFARTDFEAISEWMLDNGYSFDFISDRQMKQVKANGPALLTGGVQYNTLLLPANQYIPLATMQHILRLVEDGVKLVVYKSLPKHVPGYAGHDQDGDALQALMSALRFENQRGVQVATFGKGKVYLGAEAKSLLPAAGVRTEPLAEQGLQFIRRTYQGGTVYFISNPTAKAVEGFVRLSVKHTAAAIFNPLTGQTGSAKTRRHTDGSLEVYLQLPRGASLIVQTANKPFPAALYPMYTGAGEAQPIEGTWSVKFVEGGSVLPAAKQVNTLSSWTDWDGAGYRYFSGMASYSLKFAKPKTQAKAWKIDLGQVGESADLFLNGKKIGTVLGPDYSVIIPATAMLPQNSLEVRVSNSMANRVIELEQKGVIWKKFYNTNFPSRLAENRGSDGLFTPIKWSPKASGLLGPVTLTPMRLP